MARLIDDLLTVARVEGGQLHLSTRPTELAPLLAQLSSTQTDEVLVSCADDIVIEADPERVAQIVNNLVSNARHHGTPPVTVTTAVDGDATYVSPGAGSHRFGVRLPVAR